MELQTVIKNGRNERISTWNFVVNKMKIAKWNGKRFDIKEMVSSIILKHYDKEYYFLSNSSSKMGIAGRSH